MSLVTDTRQRSRDPFVSRVYLALLDLSQYYVGTFQIPIPYVRRVCSVVGSRIVHPDLQETLKLVPKTLVNPFGSSTFKSRLSHLRINEKLETFVGPRRDRKYNKIFIGILP